MSLLRRMIGMAGTDTPAVESSPTETTRTTASERRAALHAAEAEIKEALASRLAELERAGRHAHVDAARKIEEARAADMQRASAIDAELAAAIVRGIYPLAVEFANAPRATAKKIGDEFRVLSARADADLGEPLAAGHLVTAFLVANGLSQKAGFVDLTAFEASVAAETAFARLAMADAPAPALEEALRALEARVSTDGMRFNSSDQSLVAIRQAHAGRGHLARAIARLRGEAEERLAPVDLTTPEERIQRLKDMRPTI